MCCRVIEGAGELIRGHEDEDEDEDEVAYWAVAEDGPTREDCGIMVWASQRGSGTWYFGRARMPYHGIDGVDFGGGGGGGGETQFGLALIAFRIMEGGGDGEYTAMAVLERSGGFGQT